MRRIITMLLTVLPVMAETQPEVTTLWAAGVNAESGWYDFNKTYDRSQTGDSMLCWAIVAANLTAWWQEQNPGMVPEGTPRTEAIWPVFRGAFENMGSDPDQGIRWWFSGNYVRQKQGNQLTAKLIKENGAGYYRQTTVKPEHLLYRGRGAEVSDTRLSEAFYKGFSRGDAFWVGATSRRPDGTPFMHSLTVWGVDASIAADGTPCIHAIYMCDSDDRRRILHRLPVKKHEGRLVLNCNGHPLYGRLGLVQLDAYTGMRRQPETPASR